MKVIETIRRWARELKREAVAMWFVARDPRTPWLARALCVFVVAYALSPIDLIPDFIPVLGFVDDALLSGVVQHGGVHSTHATDAFASNIARQTGVRWRNLNCTPTMDDLSPGAVDNRVENKAWVVLQLAPALVPRQLA